MTNSTYRNPMTNNLQQYLNFLPEVSTALSRKSPVVALETAVVTHGLPQPHNYQLAKDLENVVRSHGAVPAVIGLLDGQIHIGLTDDQLKALSALTQRTRKISHRDFAIALSQKINGGTTVAGTLIAAKLAGIKVFATGGIGGVHRDSRFDISADLPELSRCPLIVVCSGAKSILDLPATLEYLETAGIPILGYQTTEFPAFFSRESGLGVDATVETPDEIVEIARAHWGIGLNSAILVVVAPPASTALPRDQIEDTIEKALSEARELNISGSKVTPFLLEKVKELSKGASLESNLDLLKHNAEIAAQIAAKLAPGPETRSI